MIPGTIVYVTAVMLTSVCKEYYQFILCQGLVGGISNGMLFSAAMCTINHYFHKKRGAAMGLVAVGSGFGGVLIPIILDQCFKSSKIGFGWGVRILGFGMLVALTLSCVFVKERLPPRTGPFFVLSAFSQPSYALLSAGIFLLFWAVFLPFFFLTEYALTNVHMSSNLAFYLISVLNGTSLFGRIIFGGLSDKLGPKNILASVSLINGILILCWTLARTNAGIIVWAAVFGFFSGGQFGVFPSALASVTPNPQFMGTYIGQAVAVASIAALTGSPLGGALITKYGYFHATIFAGISFLVGGALITGSRFCHKPQLRAVA